VSSRALARSPDPPEQLARGTQSFPAERCDPQGASELRSVLPGLDPIKCNMKRASTTSGRPSVLQAYTEVRAGRCTLKNVVCSSLFDLCTCFFIVSNAAFIGVQTDYMARHVTDKIPFTFRVIESIYCAIFTMELLLRLAVHGRKFFTMSGYRWNMFDAAVVCLQLFEEIMALITGAMGSDHNSMPSNFSMMRMMRVLRLIRIIRLVRVLRLISELRTIVVSIIGSMRSLCWTIILLVLMMYLIGVYLTQLVTDHKADNELDPGEHQSLTQHYGSLLRSILTLFQSISGGIDWDDGVSPLMSSMSPWLALLFSFYIAFAIFALMNIVTGVFVESALQTAKDDKELFLLHHVRNLFVNADTDRSGRITWPEFQKQVENPSMNMYFKAIDLDKEEARDLFRLIDIDESGTIDAEEFVNGCFRLRGPAKAIDLATLMHETKRMNRKWREHALFVEKTLTWVVHHVQELPYSLDGA